MNMPHTGKGSKQGFWLYAITDSCLITTLPKKLQWDLQPTLIPSNKFSWKKQAQYISVRPVTRFPLCFICLISAATRGRYKIDHKITSWKIVSRSLTKCRPTFAAEILLEIWNKWLINFLWMSTSVTENRTWICMLRWKLIGNTVTFWIAGLKTRSSWTWKLSPVFKELH